MPFETGSGGSTTPTTGAMRRNLSYSSTYHPALPSHHAVDAKTASIEPSASS